MPKQVGVSIVVTNCILLSALLGKYIDNKNNFRVDHNGHKFALFTAKYREIYTILKCPTFYKYKSIGLYVPYLTNLSLAQTIQRRLVT